jgi:hypothetical protein
LLDSVISSSSLIKVRFSGEITVVIDVSGLLGVVSLISWAIALVKLSDSKYALVVSNDDRVRVTKIRFSTMIVDSLNG